MRTGQPRPLAPGTDGAAGGTPKPYEFQTVGRERSSKFLFHNYSGTKKYKPLPGGGERVPPEAFLSVVEANDPMDFDLFRYGREPFIERLKEYGLWNT